MRTNPWSTSLACEARRASSTGATRSWLRLSIECGLRARACPRITRRAGRRGRRAEGSCVLRVTGRAGLATSPRRLGQVVIMPGGHIAGTAAEGAINRRPAAGRCRSGAMCRPSKLPASSHTSEGTPPRRRLAAFSVHRSGVNCICIRIMVWNLQLAESASSPSHSTIMRIMKGSRRSA